MFFDPSTNIISYLASTQRKGLKQQRLEVFFEEDRDKEPEAMEKEWDLVTLSDGKIEVTEEQSAGSALCPR